MGMGAFVLATTTIAGRVCVGSNPQWALSSSMGPLVESGPAFGQCPPPMSCCHPKA